MLVLSLHFYILLHHVKPQEFLATTISLTAPFCFIVLKALCAHACANIKNNCSGIKHTLVTVTRWQLCKGMQPRRIPGLVSMTSPVMQGQICFDSKGATPWMRLRGSQRSVPPANAEILPKSQALRELSLSPSGSETRHICFLLHVGHVLWLWTICLRSGTLNICCCKFILWISRNRVVFFTVLGTANV